MSNRAYLIKKIDTELKPTLNVDEDYEWLQELVWWSAFSDDNVVLMLEFSREDVEKEIKELESCEPHAENTRRINILKGIIADANKSGEDYVLYYCY